MLRFGLIVLALTPTAALADPFALPQDLQIGIAEPAPMARLKAAVCESAPRAPQAWVDAGLAFKRAFLHNDDAPAAAEAAPGPAVLDYGD